MSIVLMDNHFSDIWFQRNKINFIQEDALKMLYATAGHVIHLIILFIIILYFNTVSS